MALLPIICCGLPLLVVAGGGILAALGGLSGPLAVAGLAGVGIGAYIYLRRRRQRSHEIEQSRREVELEISEKTSRVSNNFSSGGVRMEQVILKAPQIHCDGCISSLRMAMRRVKGVKELAGNLGEKTVTVGFDPEATSVEDIKKAMARVGYEAEEL